MCQVGIFDVAIDCLQPQSAPKAPTNTARRLPTGCLRRCTAVTQDCGVHDRCTSSRFRWLAIDGDPCMNFPAHTPSPVCSARPVVRATICRCRAPVGTIPMAVKWTDRWQAGPPPRYQDRTARCDHCRSRKVSRVCHWNRALLRTTGRARPESSAQRPDP